MTVLELTTQGDEDGDDGSMTLEKIGDLQKTQNEDYDKVLVKKVLLSFPLIPKL